MITSLVDGANRAGVLEECGGETRLKQVYNEVLEKFGNVKNVAEGKLDYLLAGVYGLLNKTDYERAVICFKEEELRSLHPVEGIEVFPELLDKGIRTGIITDARYYQMLNQWLSMYNKQDNFLDIYTSAGKLDFNRKCTTLDCSHWMHSVDDPPHLPIRECIKPHFGSPPRTDLIQVWLRNFR